MRCLLLGLAGLSLCAPAYGQTGDVYANVGVSNRSQRTSVSGVLLGSLAPTTPFSGRDRDRPFGVTAAVGYDRSIAGPVFLGLEAAIDLGNSRQTFTANSSATASQTVIRCFPLPPDPSGIPPPCAELSRTTTVFNETQALNLNVRTGPSAALVARAGVALGGTRLWASGGLNTQRMRAAYDLPVVNTAIPPFFPFIVAEVGQPVDGLARTTTLPAEQRSLKRWMTGWTAGVGIEQRIAPLFTITARYAFANHGSVTLPATARLAPLRIESSSHTFGVGLGVRF